MSGAESAVYVAAFFTTVFGVSSAVAEAVPKDVSPFLPVTVLVILSFLPAETKLLSSAMEAV